MINLHLLDIYRLTDERVRQIFGSVGDHACGAFAIPSPVDRKPLMVIAAADLGWDHVSVSRPSRTPTWGEMEHVKRMFFATDETAMQLHVPEAQHLSYHPHCLHLWRPHDQTIPRPPALMVAPVEMVA